MSSTFGGIQQASSSLAASQYGLQIVEQNISNASTPGYTRQSVDLSAADTVGGVPRRYVTGGSPSGVKIVGTSRLNDPVVDARARTEHARGATADTAASQLSQIEDVFPEPSDSGLGGQLTTFWSDWANVANTPSSGAARGVLLQDAGTVADTLNAMSQSLSNVKQSTANSLAGQAAGTAPFVPTAGDLGQANQAAASLAALNKQIALGNVTGTTTNSLLDQRDQLLDQLSSLVGGVATINADGSASVAVGADATTGLGGQPLVDGTHSSYNQLQIDPSNYDISLVTSDATPVSVGAVSLSGGSAAASVTTLTKTLSDDPTSNPPGVMAQLNAVAQKLADAVNAIQAGGHDQSGATGSPMFGTSDGSPTVTAANIEVVMADATKVAAASGTTIGSTNDGSNALKASSGGVGTDSPDASYASLVGFVGSKSSLAQQQQQTQDAVTASVDALRQSASGVSLDEEVTNMLTLQQSYQASSKVLATMNSMLDTLINGLGIGS